MYDKFSVQGMIQFLTVKKGLSQNTVRLILSRWGIFHKWAKEHCPFKERPLTHKDNIEKFLFELHQRGLKNNSINSYIFMLRMIHEYMIDRNIPTDDFMRDLVTLPKTHPDIEILTPEEIAMILKSKIEYGNFQGKDANILNDIYFRFTLFLASTGCRFSEASSLKVKNFKGDYVVFENTKNHETRRAYIYQPLRTVLEENCKDKSGEQLIFQGLTGREILPQNYNSDLKKRALKMGINKNVHPHIFRHSFATQLLLSGCEITMVATLIGHKDIQTTYQNYVHLADESLKKATMRHPLIRQNISPAEIIRITTENIKNMHFENDPRFNYKVEEGRDSLKFEVYLKGLIFFFLPLLSFLPIDQMVWLVK